MISSFPTKIRTAIAAAWLIMITSTITTAQDAVIYRNAEASVEDRVEDLLRRMSLDEKIGQMTQINVDMINLNKDNYAYIDTVKARAAIRNHHIGSFLNGFAIPAEDWFAFTHTLQRINLEESRLGIPILYGIDHMHGASYLSEATIFPHAFNLANTFDTTFAWHTGRITALESAPLGHNWNFAPVLDAGRDPRWPRFYETFGESPTVVSRMGAAYVRGLQEAGQVGPYRVAATAKHFLGYSTPVSGKDRSPAHIPDQILHEVHRPGFQAAIDAGIQTVMVNSGEVNGVPVHASYDLLTRLLRDEMGFEGVILTDWADIIKLTGIDKVAFQQEHYHRVAYDEKEATRMSVLAGIDMSMTPMSYDFVTYVRELVHEGHISEARIDSSVRRVLRLKFELGLFEQPLPTLDYHANIGTPEHRSLAYQAASESIVLLRNERNLLPLSPTTRNILVVGDKATSKRALNGGWTKEWQGGTEAMYPAEMPTILDAIRAEFPGATVNHISDPGSPRTNLRRTFNRLSSNADVIIAVVGEWPYTEFVGDINDLTLDADQVNIIQTLMSSGKPHAVILVEGRPRVLPGTTCQAQAVLFAGLPGQEGASAIAHVLSGKINPSGRLSFSYPKFASHFSTYDHKATDRPSAMWPFGHGLSYTTFAYRDLIISDQTVSTDGSLLATVTVQNTGSVAGKHAVLWFLTDEIGRITRPVRKLVHYDKDWFEPGESRTFSFRINADEHLWYPDARGRRIFESGRFILRVDSLHTDFTLTTLRAVR